MASRSPDGISIAGRRLGVAIHGPGLSTAFPPTHRSALPGDGNLVITVHPDSGDTPTKRIVTTTFSGAAVDYALGRERMSIDTTVRSAFSVVSDSTDLLVLGFDYGAVTFSGTTGVTVACDQIFWNLTSVPTLDRAP